MGGAKRYPSIASYGDDGFRRLNPSYALSTVGHRPSVYRYSVLGLSPKWVNRSSVIGFCRMWSRCIFEPAILSTTAIASKKRWSDSGLQRAVMSSLDRSAIACEFMRGQSAGFKMRRAASKTWNRAGLYLDSNRVVSFRKSQSRRYRP